MNAINIVQFIALLLYLINVSNSYRVKKIEGNKLNQSYTKNAKNATSGMQFENRRKVILELFRNKRMVKQGNDKRRATATPNFPQTSQTDYDDDGGQEDVPIVGPSPRKQRPKFGGDPTVEPDSTLPWTIAGMVFGGAFILIVVIVVVVSKSAGKSDDRSPSAADSTQVPPEDVEKYNDVNGPPSFTESISLPSETNGSNSENDEKSVSDDDVTGYSVSQSKKDSKKHSAPSVNCEEDFSFQ